MTRLTALAPLALAALLAHSAALAKLPAPSDDAKAKAAEAAAKAAHTGKVDGYKLCLSMTKVAADYQATAKKSGKAASAPTDTPPCTDPGAFVYTPAVTAPAVAAVSAAAPAMAAAPMAAPASAKK